MGEQKSGFGADVDLFGNALLPMKDTRGRKAFRKTQENQRLVMDLAAGGMTQGQISTVLGCDEKTLRKYYSRELAEATVLVQGEAIRVLMHKMRMGNLAATNRVLELTGAQVPVSGRSVPAKPKAPPPLGKKEQLQKSAGDLPSGWGDLLGNGGKPVN